MYIYIFIYLYTYVGMYNLYVKMYANELEPIEQIKKLNSVSLSYILLLDYILLLLLLLLLTRISILIIFVYIIRIRIMYSMYCNILNIYEVTLSHIIEYIL